MDKELVMINEKFSEETSVHHLFTKPEIRKAIVKRYIQIIYGLSSEKKESVLNSIYSENEEDKMDVEQFLDYYSIEEEIYKQYKKELTKEKYIKIYDNVIKEFINNKINLFI